MSKKLGFNISDLLAQPVAAAASTEYHQDRPLVEPTPSSESNHHLSNYEQLMRASSIYRNQDYSLLPIVNGTYPWIQTDSVLKDRFSCKFMRYGDLPLLMSIDTHKGSAHLLCFLSIQ